MIHPSAASAAPATPPTDHDQPSAGQKKGRAPTRAEYFGTAIGTDGSLAHTTPTSGEDLDGAVNGLSWTIGKGYVVTFGSEIGFRAWNRSEQRTLFNAAYYGPSTKLTADQFQRLGK
ncbi:hypothetical protein [Streptomyces lushanensis]|uniref:hypothetical protein n=1 Tax=Streptomyces lushanensis TaxID=1434255 RepID=UPI00082C0B13|nr:hypothetical protein [Streptomyces lushanensis]